MGAAIRLVIIRRLDRDPVIYVDQRIEQNPVNLGVYTPNLTIGVLETVHILTDNDDAGVAEQHDSRHARRFFCAL